jgi:RNA-directed DNA polymerase
MADTRLTRQQIYDRIRETSRDEFVLEEMKRLGFWKKDEGSPSLPELMIKKETELSKELNKLVDEKRKFENKEAVLKEMRMKRMAAAKLKREETKKKREQARYEKSEAWRAKKDTQIIFLGADVSVGLNNTENNNEQLAKNNLPVFNNESDLAAALGIDIKELRFLCFQRRVSQVSHYRKFYLPKKSGGKRLISAPMPRLKKVQYWIFENILNKVPLHNAAHGFVPSRSIVSNAQPHVKKDIVINLDIKDFFPFVTFKRVKAIFQKIGYSEKNAVLLALICTEANTEQVEIDGKKYFVQKGNRFLPQGAPTSPALTNILCYRMDKRLAGLASKLNCAYTRYADDITFSSDKSLIAQQAVWRIKRVIKDEGFDLHPDKTRIMRAGAKQEVTGLVVNKKLNSNRKKYRQLRAVLHQMKHRGAENIKWGNGDLATSILGYINFVKMTNPQQANKLQQAYSSLFNNSSGK